MNLPLRGLTPDPFDPRSVFAEDPQGEASPIWISDTLATQVSPEDASYLLQWRWSRHFNDKGHLYVARLEGAWPITKRRRVFMHREIMLRIGPPPSPEHRYVDHKNGDTLDNRRRNLRWATAAMNAKNTWLHRLAHGIPE